MNKASQIKDPVIGSIKRAGGIRTEGRVKKALQGKPLISIITVVYNGEATLQRAITSVLNQSYENIEYIIVDGGSTDSTMKIVEEYNSRIDCWVSESDQGIYDALNKGVRLSKGDWVYVLGADDVLLDSIGMVAGLLKEENGIYYGDVYLPQAHKLYDGKFGLWKLLQRNICHQAVFYPRKVFESYSYDLRYPMVADYDLMLKISRDRRFILKYMPVLVAIYNDIGGESKTHRDIQFGAEKRTIIREHFPFIIYMIYWLVRLLKHPPAFLKDATENNSAGISQPRI